MNPFAQLAQIIEAFFTGVDSGKAVSSNNSVEMNKTAMMIGTGLIVAEAIVGSLLLPEAAGIIVGAAIAAGVVNVLNNQHVFDAPAEAFSDLDFAAMNDGGELVNLARGMAVTAEIKTGSRRIVEYLLAPVLRYWQESLRER